MSGHMKLRGARERQAKTSAIYRDRSYREGHERGLCEPIHPRHPHDQFLLLPISEKLTLHYEFVLKQAREALELGDAEATIELCEHSLLKWWPLELRAFELFNQALKQANRSLDDHIAATVFGKSMFFGKSTNFLWSSYFFRGRVEPWVSRVAYTSIVVLVTLIFPGALAQGDGPLSDYADVVNWLVAGGIGALIITASLMLILRPLPHPDSLRWYWYYQDDWVDDVCPWDTNTWPDSFRPSNW
jgi:hypothetical protein